MGATLAIAGERGAYVLADRATYLTVGRGAGLEVLVEGDSALFNPYSVIIPRRARNLVGARAFADWITSAAGQRLIGEFGRERFGRALFSPAAEPGR